MTTLTDLSTHPDPLVRALAAECAAWRARDAALIDKLASPETDEWWAEDARLIDAQGNARLATDAALKEHKP